MSDWKLAAACRGLDPEVFFTDNKTERYTEARKVCVTCPVTTECLDQAMRTETGGHRYGMYGGLTPHERHDLAKGRPTARPPQAREAAA